MKGVCTVNLFKQLFWLFFFSIVGEIISLLIRPLISLPASVIGMVLLFLCLHYSILSMEKVEQVGSWLTNHMAILFVPGGVALMTQFPLLAKIWWQLILLVLVTTIITMIVTGKMVQRSIVRSQKGKDPYVNAPIE